MTYPIWQQWKRLSRFHNITAYVLEAEHQRSLSFPALDRSSIQLAGAPFSNAFKLKLSEYDEALKDTGNLSNMVLVFSWALFETHCLSILTKAKTQGSLPSWKGDFPGHVEVWADRLLKAKGRSWNDVYGGPTSIIEISALRNALAHGDVIISQSMHNRLTANGMLTSWNVGDAITIDFEKCEALRKSLRSYARVVEAKPKQIKKPSSKAKGTIKNLYPKAKKSP